MDRILDNIVIDNIDRILKEVAGSGRDYLLEHEAYVIFRMIGFDTPETIFVSGNSELDKADLSSIPGDRVVCKFISPEMPHRSEHGGIRFAGKSHGELGAILDNFISTSKKLGIAFSGMLVAEMLEINESIPWQLLLSLRQDSSFGPIVALGLGGTGTEIFQEALKDEKGLFIRSASEVYDEKSNIQALEKTIFFPIISGTTRILEKPAIDTKKIQETLAKFACIAQAFSASSSRTIMTIEELEINPLQITPGGRLVALDALMKISGRKTFTEYPPQKKIDKLLRPESILVIGASTSRMNMGRIILKNLIAGGNISSSGDSAHGNKIGGPAQGRVDRNRIWLIHPEAGEIEGCRAYPSVAELPCRVDMTVFTIPASEAAASMLGEIISTGKSESIILITGGFGELAGGRHLDRKISAAIAASRGRGDGGTVLNGPNCMGIISRPGGYNTFFLPEYKFSLDGRFGDRVAVISQSGAWLVTMISSLSSILSPRYIISVGNQMDLTVTDYLINLKDNPGIDIFCLYLEGFKPGGGKRFLDISRDIIRSGRSIIAYKAGRTAEGAAAAASHTAAMATDHDVFTRLLDEAGIYLADSLEDIEDAVKTLTLLNGKKIAGNRVGICSDAGFECSVAADRLYSMRLAPFTGNTMEKLGTHLPAGIVDVHNPVDTTPAITTVQYGKCVEAMLEDENTDCVIISNVAATATQENLPAGPGHREDIKHEGSHPYTLIRLFHATGKPMVVCINEGKIFDPAAIMMEEAGIPVFRKMDRAMKAMDIFLRFGKTRT